MRFSVSSLLSSVMVLGSSPGIAKLIQIDEEGVNDKLPLMLRSSTCPLNCHNGGACVKSSIVSTKSELGRKEDEIQWECVCPRGFVGPLCEARNRRLVDPVTCGALQCQNGGKCGEDHNYQTTKPLCDCTTAFLAIGDFPNFTLTQFVGPTCEIAVKNTNYCKRNTDLFCVNGGDCREEALDFMARPCNCTEGYTGFHCEYKEMDVQAECTLTCSGKGKCMHGFNTYGDKGANSVVPGMDVDGTKNFMHCVCDSGFAGPNCEYDYVKCGDRRAYCFHGGTCGDDGGCVCPAELKLGVGVNCEYKATDRCNNPNVVANVAANKGFLQEHKMIGSQYPFCVNDGVCYKEDGVQEYYCECDTEWKGTRCELSSKTMGPHESPAPSEYWTESPYPTIQSSITDRPVPIPTPKPTWAPTRAPTSTLASKSKSTATENEELEGGAKFGISFAVLLSVGVLVVVVVYFQSRAQYVNSIVYQENSSNNNIPEANVVQFNIPGEDDLTTNVEMTQTGRAKPDAGAVPAGEVASGPSTKEII